MTAGPSLRRQIQAIEWAAGHIDFRKGKIDTRGMRESERAEFEAGLREAVLTLRMLDGAADEAEKAARFLQAYTPRRPR
jgi:hypothetical protein